MLRRFSKKNKNPDGSAATSSDNERKNKKLLKKFLDFITSPVWSIPIASFIEGQSVVFDRVQMETEIYMEIHKEYSQLIDTLIECFCEDVGTTSAELIEAIKTINQQDISQQYKVALEPLLAAQNFNVFVPMMMRKNIELQLQALQMIEFMCGLIPSVLQLEDGESLKNMKKLTPEQTERYVLISVLRHSKDEYDAMQKGTEELEQVARNSRIQREALEREIQREEILLQQALEEGRSRNQMGTSSTQTDVPGTSSLRSVAAIMAATFAIDTATSTDDVRVQLLDSGTMTTSSTGVDAGTDAAAIETKSSRPKSAKRVGSAVGKRSTSAVGSEADPDEGRPKTSSKKMATSEAGTEERRPRTSSKKITSTTDSEVHTEDVKEKRPGTSSKKTTDSEANTDDVKDKRPGTATKKTTDSEANTEERRPRTSSKKTTSTTDSEANTDAIRKTSQSTEMSPEAQKRPGTAKGPNERKLSNAGLEDLIGAKNGSDEPKSRPSTRKSSRDERGKKTTASHEPRAKTPLQKGSEDRPATRRSSVDKNAPKRNDSVPRERKHSISQDERKPPKPIGPLRSNKYDGEVVMGRPGSPGRDHGPRRKNLNDVNSHLVDINRLNSSDVRTRAQYLKEQRDRLLQMKNEERIKQMNDIQSGGVERPKTAARAREVLDKDKKAAEEIRKEISKKLKTQILTLN